MARATARGDLALQDQHVAEVALIGLGPDVGLVVDLDELSGDAHALTGAAEAALQDVVRPQLPAESVDVPVGALVFPGGASRGDPQPIGFQPAELRDHLLRQPVTQIFLVRIAGEVVEGKNGERQPPARLGARPRTRAHPIGDQGRGTASTTAMTTTRRAEGGGRAAVGGEGEATSASAEWASGAVGSGSATGATNR